MNVRRKLRMTEIELRAYAKTHTASECAGHFGENLQSLRVYLSQHGIPFKRLRYSKKTPNPRIEEIREYAKTHTITECSRYFNIAATTMYSILYQNGIPCGKNGYKRNAPNEKEFKEQASLHTSLEMAKLFGHSQTWVYKYCHAFGVRCKGSKSNYGTILLIKKENLQQEEIKDIIKYLSLKYSNASIAKMFGYTRNRVRYLLKNNSERLHS